MVTRKPEVYALLPQDYTPVGVEVIETKHNGIIIVGARKDVAKFVNSALSSGKGVPEQYIHGAFFTPRLGGLRRVKRTAKVAEKVVSKSAKGAKKKAAK